MKLQFPMWVGSHKRLLSEVISAVPPTTRWRLRWFDGVVGHAVDEVPDQDCDIDLPFSHTALLRLAANLEDLNEILLVGVAGKVQFRVECADSSSWMISHDGDDGDVVKGWFTAFQNPPESDLT